LECDVLSVEPHTRQNLGLGTLLKRLACFFICFKGELFVACQQSFPRTLLKDESLVGLLPPFLEGPAPHKLEQKRRGACINVAIARKSCRFHGLLCCRSAVSKC